MVGEDNKIRPVGTGGTKPEKTGQASGAGESFNFTAGELKRFDRDIVGPAIRNLYQRKLIQKPTTPEDLGDDLRFLLSNGKKGKNPRKIKPIQGNKLLRVYDKMGKGKKEVALRWPLNVANWTKKEAYFCLIMIRIGRVVGEYYLQMSNLYQREGKDEEAKITGEIAMAILKACTGETASLPKEASLPKWWFGQPGWSVPRYVEVLQSISKGVRNNWAGSEVAKELELKIGEALDVMGTHEDNLAFLKALGLMRAKKYSEALKVLVNLRERIKKDNSDPECPNAVYPSNYGRARYNYVLGLDLNLAISYLETGQIFLALKQLELSVRSQAPKCVPGQKEIRFKPPYYQYLTEDDRENEEAARTDNYLRSLETLFRILIATPKGKKINTQNVEDARALYRYFLDGGEKPKFSGDYKVEAQAIFDQLVLRKKLFWNSTVQDRVHITEAKMREQLEGVYVSVAGEILEEVELIVGNEEKGIKPGTKKGNPGVKLAEAQGFLEKFYAEEKNPGNKVALNALNTWLFISFLYSQWIKTGADFKTNLPKAEKALRSFYVYAAKVGKVPLKDYMHALGNRVFIASNYGKWAKKIVEGGGDPTQEIEQAEAHLNKFYASKNEPKAKPETKINGLKTWTLIAYVYARQAENLLDAKKSPEAALAKAEEVLKKEFYPRVKGVQTALGKTKGILKKGKQILEEAVAEAAALKTLAFIAATYADWAQQIVKEKGDPKEQLKTAEGILEEVKKRAGGIKKNTLGIWISVASAYVALGRQPLPSGGNGFDRAEEILGEVHAFLDKQKEVKEWQEIEALKAFFVLSWIYSKRTKAAKKGSRRKEENIQKSAALLYAFLYGKGKTKITGPAEGEIVIRASDFSGQVSDPLTRKYIRYVADNHSGLLAAGYKKGKHDDKTVFAQAKIKYGSSELVFRLAAASVELSKFYKGQESQKFKYFAISLYKGLLEGSKYIPAKIRQDATWALAALTGKMKWVKELEKRVVEAKRDSGEKEIEYQARLLGMFLTLANAYFAFGIKAQKKGEFETSQRLFRQAEVIYGVVVEKKDPSFMPGREQELKELTNKLRELDRKLNDTRSNSEQWKTLFYLIEGSEIEVSLKMGEVLKVSKKYEEALRTFRGIKETLTEELEKTKDEKGKTALRRVIFLAKMNEQEVQIAIVKRELYAGRLTITKAQGQLEQIRDALEQLLIKIKQDPKLKQSAALMARLANKLIMAYGSLGGLKAKTPASGEEEFLKGEEEFLKAAALVKSLLGLEDLWGLDKEEVRVAIKNMGLKEEELFLTLGHILKAAGQKDPSYLKGAVEAYKTAIKGIDPGKLEELSVDKQNLYLEAELGQIEARLLEIQGLMPESENKKLEELQTRAGQVLARLDALKNRAGKTGVTTYLLTQQKIYKALAWVYGLRGGLAEKIGGEGAGKRFFQQALKVYTDYFVKAEGETLRLYTAEEKPYLHTRFLEAAETLPAQILFDYLQVRQAALKTGKNKMEIDDKTAATLLALYGQVAAQFKSQGRKWEQMTVEMAALGFKIMLSNYYGEKGNLGLRFRYLQEVVQAIEGYSFPVSKPETNQEAEVRLRAALLVADASMTYADTLGLIMSERETEEKFARAAEAIEWVFANTGQIATEKKLGKLGIGLDDLRVNYLRSCLKGRTAQHNPVFAGVEQILGQLDKDRQSRSLTARERKFFMRAYATLGNFFIWDQQEQDVKKAKAYYTRVAEEAKKVSPEEQKSEWFKAVMAEVYKGQAWVALQESMGKGGVLRWGSKKDYEHAKTTLEALVVLLETKPLKNSRDIHTLGLAHYMLAELDLRGRAIPDLGTALQNYQKALAVLKQDKVDGEYRSPDVASLAADVHSGMADALGKQRKYAAAREQKQQYLRDIEALDKKVRELKKKLKLPSTSNPKLDKKQKAGRVSALRLWEAQIEEASYLRSTVEYSTNEYQGNKETSFKGGLEGEARVFSDPDNNVKVGGKIAYGPLNRTIESRIKQGDNNCENKNKCEERTVNQKLLETHKELKVGAWAKWRRNFGQVGVLDTRLSWEMYRTPYTVYRPEGLGGRTTTSSFLANRVALGSRFTFTGFREIGGKVGVYPFIDVEVSYAWANKSSGLEEINRNAANSMLPYQESDLAAQGLQRKLDAIGGNAHTVDGEMTVGTNWVFMPTGYLELILLTAISWRKNTWDQTSHLFFPETVKHPGYYTDGLNNQTHTLNTSGWLAKVGLLTKFYLQDVIIPVSVTSNIYLDGRGYDVIVRAEIVPTRSNIPVRGFMECYDSRNNASFFGEERNNHFRGCRVGVQFHFSLDN